MSTTVKPWSEYDTSLLHIIAGTLTAKCPPAKITNAADLSTEHERNKLLFAAGRHQVLTEVLEAIELKEKGR